MDSQSIECTPKPLAERRRRALDRRQQATTIHLDQTVLYTLGTKRFNRNRSIVPRDPDSAVTLQPLWRRETERTFGGTLQDHEVTLSGLPQHRLMSDND